MVKVDQTTFVTLNIGYYAGFLLYTQHGMIALTEQLRLNWQEILFGGSIRMGESSFLDMRKVYHSEFTPMIPHQPSGACVGTL